jgi:Zn-finger protein
VIRYNQTLFYIGIEKGNSALACYCPEYLCLFKEMSESELARRFNVDFDDICRKYGNSGSRSIIKGNDNNVDKM